MLAEMATAAPPESFEILKEPVELPMRKGTLLIVDDEDGPRQALRVVFKDDYDILMAADGPTAIQMAQSQRIDVALLDIRMAGMSGIEVLERLKFVEPSIEVVMMTAFETTNATRLEVEDLEFIKDRLRTITRQTTNCIEISRRYLGFLRRQSDDMPQVGVNQLLADLSHLVRVHPSRHNHQFTVHPIAEEMAV